jgi:hypothetical protein
MHTLDARMVFVVMLALAVPAATMASEPATGSYEDLLAAFDALRALRDPVLVDGLPDYSPSATTARRDALAPIAARLAAIDPRRWDRARQVDWLVVRSALNQQRFELEVSRPWARDPGFYVDQLLEITFTELPVESSALPALRTRLRGIPRLLAAARANLDAAAADYARLAIHNLENADGVGHGHPWREVPPAGVLGWWADFASRAKAAQPELDDDIATAHASVVSFHAWLRQQAPTMTASAGVGREHLAWYLRHVTRLPWGIDMLRTMGAREEARLRSVLVLERHRNRALPALEPATTPEDYQARITAADKQVRGFIVDNEVLTIPPHVGALGTNVPWILRPGGLNFWEQIQFRDPRPDHVHAVIPGHRFDLLLAGTSTHPIRRHVQDGTRVEGWAVYLEEAFMNLGLLDRLPRTRELFDIFGLKRAVRVHADIGMQLNELTVEQAAQYMVERVPWLDRNVARVDAEIYLRQPPGYGLGYMIGKVQMDALLADRARQLGDTFVLKDFHDQFLASGLVPIAFIRYEMTGLDDEVASFFVDEPLP